MSEGLTGRELDAAVARALGWDHVGLISIHQNDYIGCPPEAQEYRRYVNWEPVRGEEPPGKQPVPHYSTDTAAAAQVRREMLGRGYSFALWDVPPDSSVQPGVVAAFCLGVCPPERHQRDGAFRGWAPCHDAPLAICRAALAALAATAEGESRCDRCEGPGPDPETGVCGGCEK